MIDYHKIWNKHNPDNPMPEEGCVIHHIDFNHDNNDINNLVKMTDSEHKRLHSLGDNNIAKRTEVRKKISESKKDRNNPMYGKHHTEEAKNKMSGKLKGRINLNKGRKLSEEIKRKISETLKGHKHTEETKRKISKSKKGENNPMKRPETKRKLSEMMKGRKSLLCGRQLSAEHKKKISESVKKYWKNKKKENKIILPCEAIKPLIELLEKTKETSQMYCHHPEGTVYNHSIQTLHHALRESDDIDLILAAMLHDIGKIDNSHGHGKIGSEMLEDLKVSGKTRWLIEHHMRVWAMILGEMKKYGKVRYLIDHPWLPELILLARWDKMARNPNFKANWTADDILERLEKKAAKHFKKKEEK